MKKISADVITSSFFLSLIISNLNVVQLMQEFKANAYFAFLYFLNLFSKSFVFKPVVNQPLFKTFSTDLISSLPIMVR